MRTMKSALFGIAVLAFLSGCPQGPKVEFLASPSAGAAPLYVQFTDISTANGDNIAGWSWDFGDGGSSLEQNPAHSYENPGTYAVKLRIIAGGREYSKTRTACAQVTSSMGLVRITEVLAANETGLQDDDGDYSDWIEIHNGGTSPLSLSQWALSDDITTLTKWRFPAVILPANGYLVVFASGKDRAPTNGAPLHTNFSLAKNGEWLGLTDASGVLADVYAPEFPEQRADISYGCLPPETGFWYFEAPTPGAANSAAGSSRGFVPVPAFAPGHGFHDLPLSVAMGASGVGTTIRYTLDGSEPASGHGTLYTGPVPVFSNTVFRARAFRERHWPSPVVSATYIVAATEAMRSLPVLCITGDAQTSLYEPEGVMAIAGGHYEPTSGPEYRWVADTDSDYNNPMEYGGDYERPVAVEYIEPLGNDGILVNGGIRVHGGETLRASYMRCDDWLTDFKCKFSFRLYFRDDYGEEELAYPLFGNSPVTAFKSLVVRGGHHDAVNPFIKDELVRRLYGDMGHEYIHGTFVNLFINGEYKAYYNLMERYDEDFFQSWVDDGEDWEIINQDGAAEGSDETWLDLIDFTASNDLSDPAAYQQVSRQLKVSMFIDYLILQLYIANADWPHNNWVVAREARTGGEFGFYVWDAEYAFRPEYLAANGFTQFPFGDGSGLNGLDLPLPTLYRALKANPTFRTRWAEQVEAHFFTEGGALTPQNIRRRFDELQAVLAGVLPGMDTFIADQWIPMRQDIVIGQFADEGLY